LYWKFGDKGQIIIIFAILYVAIIYQLAYFAPYYTITVNSPKPYIQVLNLMVKRFVWDALSYNTSEECFLDRLNSSLNLLCNFYPLSINLSSYKLISQNGYVYAHVQLTIYDFRFYCRYNFSYSCFLSLDIVNVTLFRSYLPSFKGIRVLVKVSGDVDFLNAPLTFRVSYFYNETEFACNPNVEDLGNYYYYVYFIAPSNVHNFILFVIDWRGVKCNVIFEC